MADADTTSTQSPTQNRVRDWAYRCYLGAGAAMAFALVLRQVGTLEGVSRPVSAALLVFVMAPVTGIGISAAVVAVGLSLWVLRDPRLWMLAVLNGGLVLLWLQRGGELAAGWLWAYPAGVAVFCIRWWLERTPSKSTRTSADRKTGPSDPGEGTA